MEWTFEGSSVSGPTVIVSRDDKTRVLFHPSFSSGTAAIRGAEPLAFDRHHYFELEMLSDVYGTDVMIGVGTAGAAVDSHLTSFVSLIGIDKESWGFSYRGDVQHDGSYNCHHPDGGGTERGPRGLRYCQEAWREGSLVGCYFNGWRGTLEFYHNRRPYGVAFTIPKTNPVYPMVSSTAAKLSVKLTMSFSQASNLGFEAAMVLCRQVWNDDKYPFKSRLKSLIVRNNQPIPNHIRLEKMEALRKLLPPGLQRYIDQSCWFIMGCKLRDFIEAEMNDSLPKNELDVLSSSDEEETTSTSPSKKIRSVPSDTSGIADDDDPWPSVGPGPSVLHFSEEEETAGPMSYVVPKLDVQKQSEEDSVAKPKPSRRFMLPSLLKGKRLSKE